MFHCRDVSLSDTLSMAIQLVSPKTLRCISHRVTQLWLLCILNVSFCHCSASVVYIKKMHFQYNSPFRTSWKTFSMLNAAAFIPDNAVSWRHLWACTVDRSFSKLVLTHHHTPHVIDCYKHQMILKYQNILLSKIFSYCSINEYINTFVEYTACTYRQKHKLF